MNKTIKIGKAKKGDIVLDEFYDFKRLKNYTPTAFITAEAEIKDICERNKILVQEIIKYDVYRVLGKKVRMRKTYEEASKLLKS